MGAERLEELDTMRSIEAASLYSLGNAAAIIDVREDDEFAAGHIQGALHIPLNAVPASLDEVHAHAIGAADATVYVICHSGYRSALATQYLHEHGVEAVNVGGGMQAWISAGFPVV